MVSIDFFTVPTIMLRVLFVFVVLEHRRRQVLHFSVTEHPTPDWTASRSSKHWRIVRCRDTSFEIATASTAMRFACESHLWE